MVLSGPEVGDIGFTATEQDPAGGVLSSWQPGTFGGSIASASVPGAPVWYELMTPDLAAARDFYTRLFCWSARSIRGHVDGCVFADRGGRPFAGVRAGSAEDAQATAAAEWRVGYAVPDGPAAAIAAQHLGATILDSRGLPGYGRGWSFIGPDDLPGMLAQHEDVDHAP